MPGKGRSGQVRGKQEHRQGEAPGPDPAPPAGANVGHGRPDSAGRSEWSPGQMKKAAGAGSARAFAPGHGGEPPGRLGRPEDGTEDEGETLT